MRYSCLVDLINLGYIIERSVPLVANLVKVYIVVLCVCLQKQTMSIKIIIIIIIINTKSDEISERYTFFVVSDINRKFFW